MTVQIEKGIPIPAAKNRMKWPFGDLEVGDSFVMPCTPQHVGGLIASAHRRFPDRRFTQRMLDDGIRVWRVK